MSKRIFIQHQQFARNASAQSIRAELTTSAPLNQQLGSLENLLRYPGLIKVDRTGTPLPRCNDYLEGEVDDASEGEPANADQIRASKVVPSHWASYHRFRFEVIVCTCLNAFGLMALLNGIPLGWKASFFVVAIVATCYAHWLQKKVKALLDDMLVGVPQQIKLTTQPWLQVYYLGQALKMLRELTKPDDKGLCHTVAEAGAQIIQDAPARGSTPFDKELIKHISEKFEEILVRCFQPVARQVAINDLLLIFSLMWWFWNLPHR